MAQLFQLPKTTVVDANLRLVSGAKAYFHVTLTNTPQNVYVDEGLTVPHSNPVVADSAGVLPPIWLDERLIYGLTLNTSADVLIYTVDPIGDSLARDLENGANVNLVNSKVIKYDKTTAERGAGVTPVNFAYLPMCVDRYATNAIPGTTSMVAAFNMAYKVALQAGGTITYGATGLYLLDAPLNFTVTGAPNNKGVIVRGPSAGVDAPVFAIIAKHTGVAIFDCTGNDAITFYDVAATTDPATFPNVGILTARNNSGGSLIFRAQNVYMVGAFSVAPYYNYGSEDDVLINCYWDNTSLAAGTATRVYTSNNVKGLTSPFVTIATGSQSCIDHNDFGCLDNNWAGTPTSDCVYLEAVSGFKKYGGWWNNGSQSASGRALMYVDMSNAPSSLVKLHGVTGENGAHNSQYGVLFSNHVQTPTGWNIDACNIPNVTAAIATAGTNPVLDNFSLRDLVTVVGGISITGTLQNSASFDFGSITTAIGTSVRNRLTGDIARLTVTTRTDDNWIDTGSTGKVWTPALGTVSHGGVLTINETRCLFHGNQVTVEFCMTDTVSITATAAQTITGLPAAAHNRSAMVLVANESTGVAIGAGFIEAGATSMKMPAFTVGAGVTVCVSATYFVA